MEPTDRPNTTPPEAIPPADETPEEEAPLGAGFDFADPNSPLAPYYLRTSHLVALMLVVLFVLLARLLPLVGGPLWADLAFGRWALEHGGPPAHEPFSPFSDPEAPVVRSGWLGQAALAWAYNAGAALAPREALGGMAGGVELLRWLYGLLVAAFCALALLVFSRRAGSLALGCLGLALLLLASPLLLAAPRPELFGLLCFLGLLALVQQETPDGRRRAPLLGGWPLVPPLLVLWANLHPSFLLGLLVLFLFLVGRAVERGAVGALRDGRALGLLVALAASAGAVAFLTPDGPAVYARLVGWATNGNVMDLTQWQPLDFSDWRAVHTVFLGSLALLTLLLAASGRPFTPTELLMLLTFVFLGLWRQAATGWWFVVAAWLVVAQAGAALDRFWPHLREPSTPDLRKTLLVGVLSVVLVVLLLPLGWITSRKPRPLATSLAPDVPWEVVERLLAEGRFSGSILSGERASDFLLFALPEGMPVFLYGEVYLFPRRHWEEDMAVRAVRPDWWEVLDRHRVNLVVLGPGQDRKLADALKEDAAWEVMPPAKDARVPWFVAVRKRPL